MLKSKEKQFSIFFDKHYSKLYSYSYKILNEKEVSEEIVQETFIKLWENFEKINKIDHSIEAYLITILKNKIIDYYRKGKSHKKNIDLYLLNKCTTAEIDANWELTSKIDLVYSKLPKKTIEIFRFSREKGFTYQEIAQKKEISVKTVELHISKALKAFRIGLKDYL